MNDTVTVANTAPVAGTVTITPASPTTNQTLTATPAGFTDADGDSLTYHYQWFNNGSPLAGETSSTLDLSVAGNGNRGDLIKVEVYATDGNAGTSSTVNDTVTVANTAPVAVPSRSPLPRRRRTRPSRPPRPGSPTPTGTR